MHVRMLFNHRHQVEPWPELVQSTDQAFHAFFLFLAALIIAAV